MIKHHDPGLNGQVILRAGRDQPPSYRQYGPGAGIHSKLRLRQHGAMKQEPRLATCGDLLAVEEIVQTAYSHYVSRIGREPGPMLDDYRILIEEGRVHVVERDSVVRGILVLIPQDDAVLLDNIAVCPGAQGSGLGRRMLEFAERTAITAGFRSIRLYTNETMIENIEFYSRLGYSETHRAEEKGLRRVYMAKPLA
jgi:ribosomal protein S18 acetylase RimI-like enzyme